MKIKNIHKTVLAVLITTLMIGSGFIGAVNVEAIEGISNDSHSIETGKIEVDVHPAPYDPPYDPWNPPEQDKISVNTNPDNYIFNNHQINYTIEDFFNYPDELHITQVRDDGTTEPPWDDGGSGGRYIIPPVCQTHIEQATNDSSTGHGHLRLMAFCIMAQWYHTQVYCWFKGSYVCHNTGYHIVNFDINYDGIVTVGDQESPEFGFGDDKFEVLAVAGFQIAGSQPDTDMIYYEDSYPHVGGYDIPRPNDEQGPFKIGYNERIYLQAGYEYDFIVQFNLFLDCYAFGLLGVGGQIDLDCWLLDADIHHEVNPTFIDLVSAEAVQIGDQIGYTIWTDPWYFQPGDYVYLHATIWNEGIDNANGFHIAMGLKDQYGNNYWYAESEQLFNCPAGSWPDNALSIYTTNPIPWPSDTNIYYVWCWVDCAQQIDEIVEDNNIGIHPHQAQGTPNLEIEEMTLIHCEPWPPDINTINWQQADSFSEGDRVTPFALISNVGDGVALDCGVKLYLDDSFFVEGYFSLAGEDSVFAYVETNGNPGFNWPDSNCHTFRWEVDRPGEHEEDEETYCPEAPVLSYSPHEIHFGTHDQGWSDSRTFEIWNSGDGALTYTISESLSWITSINPSGGSSTGEYDTITVNVGNTGSMSGYSSGYIDISSNGGNGQVFVDITINAGPQLSYSPDQIHFGEHTQGWTGDSTFEIWNSGGGTLDYSISESLSWITSVNPSSGSSTGEHDTITVNVGNTWSMFGYYSGDIQISSNGGSGSVHVEINIGRWILPDNHNDPGASWNDETNAYDNNFDTKATCRIDGSQYEWYWTPWLELTLDTARECSKIGFCAWYSSTNCRYIEINVYDDGGTLYHHYDADYWQNQGWEEVSFDPALVQRAEIRFRMKPFGFPYYYVVADLHEFQFYEVP